MNRYARKSIKILLWFLGIIILLVGLALLLIQTPFVQKIAKNKIVTFLEEKIKTPVSIGRLSIDFPKRIVLEDVYFEDQSGDTLLLGDTLKVDIRLLKLLSRQIEIREIDLRGVTSHIKHTLPDSAFNFDYILKAFIKGKEKKVDSTAGMVFSVDKINLDRFNIKMDDEVNGNNISIYLNHFDTRITTFDLENKKFTVPKIKLAGLTATLRQTKALSRESIRTDTINFTPSSAFPDIELEEINISDIHIDYENTVTSVDSRLDLDSLLIEFNDLDLLNQEADVRLLRLANTSGHFELGETAQEAVKATAIEVKETLEKGWRINLEKLGISNVDFKFDDMAQKQVVRGIDYDHIDIKDLKANFTHIAYNADTISGAVNHISLTEQSGLNLKNFRGDFYFSKQHAALSDYVIETSDSYINDHFELFYPSLDTIAKDPGVITVDAQFENSKIAVSDILLFAPNLINQPLFSRNQRDVIFVDGNISGRLNNLDIDDLNISGIGDIRLLASGNIRGLPDADKMSFDVDIERLSASATDLSAFIPRRVADQVRIPESVTMRGSFKGTFDRFTTDMNISTSLGNVTIDGTIQNVSNPARLNYNTKIKTTGFDLGRFLRKEEKIGKITIDAVMTGTGTDLKTANARIEGNIGSFEFNGYTYQNIKLTGTARSGDLDVQAKLLDPNITLDIDALANTNGQYPKLNMTLNVDTLNLQKLNFYEKDLRFSGKITADLETADLDYLNGTIQGSNIIIGMEGEQYRLDTVSIVSVATAGDDSLDIRTEFLTAHFAGNYNLTKLWPALSDNIDRYFDITPGKDSTIAYDPQRVRFSINLVRSPLIEELIPDLKDMEDAHIAGNFDSQSGEILIDGGIPYFRYKGFTVDNFKLNLNTEAEALNYSFKFDELRSEKLQVLNTSLSGKAQNNKLGISLQVKDAEEKEQYRIAGDMTSANRVFEFSMLSDGLILNYEPWNIAPNNAISIGKEGLMIRDFAMSKEGQQISVNSTPQQLNSPIDIRFKDFQIETFTRLVSVDSLLAGGRVNGLANIRNMNTNAVFTTDLTIDDFSFRGDTVGHIDMKVNNETANTYAADIRLTGDGNDVKIIGSYFDDGTKNLYDLNIDIVALNMKSIEGFTMNELDDGSGTLTGDLTLKGTLAEPTIRGDIQFRDVGFRITRFNSPYKVTDETIRFVEDGVAMDDFTLQDSLGNVMVLDGRVFTTDYKEFRFDMDIHSDDFQVLNSTKENNKLYFGQLFIDTDINLHGGMNAPIIDGHIKVNEKTKLTIVIPQEDPGLVEREGIVQFIDQDTFKFTFLATAQDSLKEVAFKGVDLAVNIEIDKEAELNLIIDETNGDYLNVKGVGSLSGGVDPSGKVTLTGTYELVEGTYRFSFNQVKREFKINKGSYIQWNGEPLRADVNVTAVYIANTAPLTLVQNQLADAEQNVINTYKQRLPFEILLTMKGELMKPQVAFDINLPEGNFGVSSEVTSTVQSRLVELRTEPSELNKQVFAVLILNRFISENPFQNQPREGGITSLARQSASKLLSEQLNNLVGGMIAGFDLTFDINSVEDYTTGELRNRTDLTVGLTKQLLDDRLKVSVGSNFELEGLQETDRKTTNIAGDISAEYQLSKDGRYLVRAYRKDEYIIVQGQVVETGVGFVFQADYDELKDLFTKKTEEQKNLQKTIRLQRKEEKQERNDEE